MPAVETGQAVLSAHPDESVPVLINIADLAVGKIVPGLIESGYLCVCCKLGKEEKNQCSGYQSGSHGIRR